MVNHANLPRHQLVQQRLEQFFQNSAFPSVQVDFAINGLEDGDDFALLVEIRSRYNLNLFKCALRH